MQPAPPSPPPSAAVIQLVVNVWLAQAAATAAKLGVPERLASGARTADELAGEVEVDAGMLYRLLRALAAGGLLIAQDDGRFATTPVFDCLRADAPGSMRSWLIAVLSPGHWLPWEQLEQSIRTAGPVAENVLGMPLWQYYQQHPVEGRYFAEGMTGVSAMAVQAVLAATSFAGARVVIDVGGSQGSFLAAILQREPAARGVLFDRPEVVATAGPALAAAGVAERVERIGGDFLVSVPGGGDVYLLKHVLHDWDDATCVTILKNVAKAMLPESRLVIVEMAVGGPGAMVPLLDLTMHLMFGGKERTAEQFAALLAQAGLALKSVTPTRSFAAVLEARLAQ